MVYLLWPGPAWIARQIFLAMTVDIWDNLFYDFKASVLPLLAFLSAFTYALYLLAYPPKYRKLSICTLAIPIAYTFVHQKNLFPSHALNDMFGRFLYIWFANMSYEVTILEYTPRISKENDGWKSRVRQAYKMIFCRTHEEHVPRVHQKNETRETDTAKTNRGVNPTDPTAAPKHTHSRPRFLLIHTWKAFYLFLLQATYWVFSNYCISSNHLIYGPKYASFFRRMPDALSAAEMWSRIDITIHWCIINMFLYEAYHSAFAVLFVGLGLDTPSEWSMSLFGPLSTAWSVRRYWGKHWHNYIYHSFSGHTKVVTRTWLGMRRGRTETRLLENTIVFGASGLMHSAVRWAQDGDGYDYWCIALWYVGQMLPIVVEGVVQELWRRKKKDLGLKDTRGLRRAERWVGYAWVIGFNMWSIPKYVHTRDEWSDRAMRKRYASEVVEYEKKGDRELVGMAPDREL